MIYRMVIERILRNAFTAINRGDYAPVLASFGSLVEHIFFGDHALAGARQSIGTIAPWYVRLKKLLPDLRFDIASVAISGWPWDTVALVEWRDHFTLRNGASRINQGVHALRLRWGKVVSLRIYCDTQVLAAVLQELSEQGVEEARLKPICG